jgi:hypothetical protein
MPSHRYFLMLKTGGFMSSKPKPETTLTAYLRECAERREIAKKLEKKGYLSITHELQRLKNLGLKAHAPHFIERYGRYYDSITIITGIQTKSMIKIKKDIPVWVIFKKI